MKPVPAENGPATPEGSGNGGAVADGGQPPTGATRTRPSTRTGGAGGAGGAGGNPARPQAGRTHDGAARTPRTHGADHGPARDVPTPPGQGPDRATGSPRVPTYEKWRAPEATRGNALHAGAWWLWALGLATAASRTTNPLLLGLIVGVAGYVVAARRTDAPWARSYGAFVKLGLFVIGLRLVFSMLLGSPIPGTHTLFTLPEVPLPAWAQGIRFGGRVTAEQLVFAFYEGAKLATLLICVGAANALANPARLLKSLPAALYEVGVAVVVAMTFAPNMVADVVRLRTARRLRGRPTGGIKAILQIGLPVLEGALERSVAIAASMDARGYGRTARVPAAVRHTTNVLTLGGLLGICAGTYGLLAAEGAEYGLALLLISLLLALAGLRLGGRRSIRTRYRPDRWDARAWLVAGSGAAVAALVIRAASLDPEALRPGVVPLVAPTLPLWPAAAILIGLLPALVAPVPPSLPSQEA
ncbi:energy-coupling factor transporter transmembrane component T [Streptomyces sp. ZAF1911]|uniref:energy-coupling factor transporter transmembrane component T n=1 Tax=Streptomyces sp. ZAF1911 TaxID=2944129 RepID=UPI00237C3F35|nr:energy-coupling factor transporter transmembrane component T [Streptomyces sp. ZAF1911]MDD9381464.1 energy-coupling factor transporter transmembrane component T [Streptomyces sp. ZAF1911]